MPNVVDAKFGLKAILGEVHLFARANDAGVVDERMQRITLSDIRSAKRRTDASSAKSSAITSMSASFTSARTDAALASPLPTSRTAMMTRAPRLTSARTVANPIPRFPPVTITVFSFIVISVKMNLQNNSAE